MKRVPPPPKFLWTATLSQKRDGRPPAEVVEEAPRLHLEVIPSTPSEPRSPRC